MDSIKDMVDVTKEVGEIITRLETLPWEQRKRYREVLSETFALLNSALNLLVIRLGHVLASADEDGKEVFIRELKGLDNFDEWLMIERSVRLCSSLRTACREMESIRDKIADRLSKHSRERLSDLIMKIFKGESLAQFITDSLRSVVTMADEAALSSEGYERAKNAARDMRNALRQVRESLMLAEIEFSRMSS